MAIKFPDRPSFYADVQEWTSYLARLRKLDQSGDRDVQLAIRSAEGVIFQLEHPLEPTPESSATEDSRQRVRSRLYL